MRKDVTLFATVNLCTLLYQKSSCFSSKSKDNENTCNAKDKESKFSRCESEMSLGLGALTDELTEGYGPLCDTGTVR